MKQTNILLQWPFSHISEEQPYESAGNLIFSNFLLYEWKVMTPEE